ncbi:3'-5' exonuclease [Vibrio sp.]|uniref:3'-5' exonuclease n=1 Tax=Vibrio sp. TaxID=678 RepID=UPI003D0E384D
MLKKIVQPPKIDWPRKFAQLEKISRHPALKQFYQAGLPEPSTPLEEVRFLAIDFETTGLNSNKDDIITIGLVPFNLNRIYLNQAKHWTVRPQQNLAEESVVIHGITHSAVMDAPDLTETFPEILAQMAGTIPVVHYRRIEREFFDRALRNRIQEGIEFPVVDTMAIETQLQHKVAGGLWNRIKGRKPESVRLGRTRTRYGLPPYTPHHALTDAIATAELLQAQVRHNFDSKDTIDQLWL